MTMYPSWEKVRDAVGGERLIKFKKELYLPKASGMDDSDYRGYLTRAQFFNATGRTLDGLSGLVNRKPVLYTIPKGMEKYLDNVDGKGHTFTQFCANAVREKLITNWGGVLLDMPSTDEVVSQADFERQNLSAYMTYYPAEAIINWKWGYDGRRQFLQYVIFREKIEVQKLNYTTELKFNYRVCEIDDEGLYHQILFDDKDQIIEDVYPKNKNGNLRSIPFKFLSLSDYPQDPILEDLINVNLSHYRKSADYENGLHWTGVPTPWTQGAEVNTVIVNGREVAAEPLKLGGSVVLNLPSGASLNYLEFGGSGCTQIANGMRYDEDRMAILGARIISQERNGVEAAETARIHRAGENSVLAEIAQSLSYIFKQILTEYLEWSSGTDVDPSSVEVQFNTDYDVAVMNPQQLTALVSLWQNGGISKRDLFDNLKEGEVLSADRDFDEMCTEIDEEQQAKIPVQLQEFQEQLLAENQNKEQKEEENEEED